jgi:hypothetical protein
VGPDAGFELPFAEGRAVQAGDGGAGQQDRPFTDRNRSKTASDMFEQGGDARNLDPLSDDDRWRGHDETAHAGDLVGESDAAGVHAQEGQDLAEDLEAWGPLAAGVEEDRQAGGHRFRRQPRQRLQHHVPITVEKGAAVEGLVQTGGRRRIVERVAAEDDAFITSPHHGGGHG